VATVLEWYFQHYHRTRANLGTADTFVDRSLLGAFTADRSAFSRGEGYALTKVLVACTFFQKRQDQQVLRILKQMRPQDAATLTDVSRIRSLLASASCEHLRTLEAVGRDCRLTKEPASGKPTCQWPRRRCHLKEHTVVMKRYGHFGKIPTTVALMLDSYGVTDLRSLRASIFAATSDPGQRADQLQRALCRIWRVADKISAMFLSAVSNPDLSEVPVPWVEGMAWQRFVVVDSNTDAFLRLIGYDTAVPYEARRNFINEIARKVDIRRLHRQCASFNPRVIQQAMYVFMGRTSRRANPADCCNAPGACARCPRPLRGMCPVADSGVDPPAAETRIRKHGYVSGDGSDLSA
jgi:hypothetical protein